MRSKLGGVDMSILHHVFLLLFMMFLCIIMLFGVILMPFSQNMQGTHKEGEFRQLEIWTWKSYVRLLIVHNSKQTETSWRIFMEYMKNIGTNKYPRGPTRWAQPTWALQGAQARPGGLCSPRPTSGAHILVYKSF